MPEIEKIKEEGHKIVDSFKSHEILIIAHLTKEGMKSIDTINHKDIKGLQAGIAMLELIKRKLYEVLEKAKKASE
jgi:hypothetical protein